MHSYLSSRTRLSVPEAIASSYCSVPPRIRTIDILSSSHPFIHCSIAIAVYILCLLFIATSVLTCINFYPLIFYISRSVRMTVSGTEPNQFVSFVQSALSWTTNQRCDTRFWCSLIAMLHRIRFWCLTVHSCVQNPLDSHAISPVFEFNRVPGKERFDPAFDPLALKDQTWNPSPFVPHVYVSCTRTSSRSFTQYSFQIHVCLLYTIHHSTLCMSHAQNTFRISSNPIDNQIHVSSNLKCRSIASSCVLRSYCFKLLYSSQQLSVVHRCRWDPAPAVLRSERPELHRL